MKKFLQKHLWVFFFCCCSTFMLKAQNALNFDGTDDYVTAAYHTVLNITTTISVEAWIKTAATDERYIVTKSDGMIYMAINGGGTGLGKLAVYLEGASSAWTVSNATVADDTWHHVAFTRNGTTLKLYVDGALDKTATINAANILTNASALTVGTRGGGQCFNGSMDEFRIWNTERTAAQIAANMNCELAAQTGLVAYYKFNEGSGSTTADGSGNVMTGTLTNFALSGSTSNWVTSVGSPEPPTITGTTTACSSVALTAGTPFLTLNGTTQNATVPHSTSFNFTTAFTIETWVKTTAEGYISAKYEEAWYLGVGVGGTTGKLAIYLNGVSAGWLQGTTNVADGAWHHVAATYNGSTITLYVDGVADGSVARTGNMATGSSPVEIGTRGGGSYLNCSLYDLRLWNVARTATQITSSKTNVYNTTGLVGRWKMNEYTGTSLANSSTTGSATLVGAPTWGIITTATAYLWSGGATTTTAANSFTSSNTYTVTVTNNGCTSSNSATVTVNPTVTPSVAIAASPSGAITTGTSVTFTATPTNGGTTPTYQWKNGTTDVGTGATYTSTTLAHNDVITCVMTSNAACLTTTTAISSGITMIVTASGAALNFDGTNDYVAGTSLSALSGSEQFTAEAWVTTTVGDGYRIIMGQGPDFEIGINDPNNIYFRVNNGGNNGGYTTSNPLASYNTWVHVACVYDGSQTGNANRLKIYINGVLQTLSFFGTIPSTIATNANTLKIGTTGAGQFWSGSIDEVRIWSRVLLQCEIQNNRSCELASGQTGLAAYYKFNQSSGTSLTDESGNGNTGTLTNFALTGTTSNWVTTGGVTTGTTCNVLPTPSVTIAASPSGSINAGTSVTFTATPTNGGTTPTYVWKNNGTVISGATSVTYTSTTLANNDVITCVMTSNLTCPSPATVTSAGITMTIVNTLPSVTFNYTGSEQTWTVPAGVTSIQVIAKGAKGGDGNNPNNSNSVGGQGGTVSSTLTVTPGSTLYLYVGGQGKSGQLASSFAGAARAFNGGGLTSGYYGDGTGDGGGGGATDIRMSGNALSNRVLVAGGGGGGTASYSQVAGGAGGGLVGGTGQGSLAGQGGTQSAGGAGDGFGTLGIGGNSQGGGGGGGGYYGGGSGIVIFHGNPPFNGGGGGSSYTNATLCTNVVHTQGNNNGNGVLTISYTPPTPSCTFTPTNINATHACGFGTGTYVPNGTLNGTYSWQFSDCTLQWDGSKWIFIRGNVMIFAANTTGSSTNLPCTGWTDSNNLGGCGVSDLSGGCGDLSGLVTPSVSIVASPSGAITAGTSVTFTATPTNGGTTPTYQWKNGTTDVGTGATYTSTTLAHNDEITCIMTSNATCTTTTTATSAGITIAIAVTPSVTIAASSTTICAGTSVTFTPTPTNGGSAPTYTWYKNTSTSLGTSATLTTSSLVNGDIITCLMTSNLANALPTTATSAGITMTVNALPTITGVSNQAVCAGSNTTAVTFTGTGATSYTWTNNNTATGLAASGTGNIADFAATNSTGSTITSTVTVTPVSGSPSYAYIANSASNAVSVINTTTDTVVATIAVGMAPFGVCVSPDGSRVYVSNRSSNTVSVINTTMNTVVATIVVGTNPFGVSVSPDGSRVYVANQASNNVSVINTTTNTVEETVTVGTNPFGVCVKPDGSRVYVTNLGSNTVSVINTATNAVMATIATLGTAPVGVCLSPDGIRLYVANQFSGNISVISTATNVLAAVLPVSSSLSGIAISPDGNRIYLTNSNSNTVSVMNARNNILVATVTVGSHPSGVSVSPDGSRVYVANNSILGTVSVINTTANAVIKTIAVGSSSYSLGNFITAGSVGCTGTPTAFTLTVNPIVAPSVTIAASPSGAITAGTSVTFTATATNGGTAPAYNWRKNGNGIFTTSSPTYTTSDLVNGDIITCFLTADLTTVCASPTTVLSEGITMSVSTTYTWTGNTSTDWATAANWTPNGVPSSTDNVIIPTTTNKPILPANKTIANLSLTGTNKVLLGNNNLCVNAITGGSATSYVVTDGTGGLIIKALPTNAPTTFPIGASETHYDPLRIQPTNSVDFTAKVKITANAAGFSGTIANFVKVVPLEWDITPSASAGSTVLVLTNGGTTYTPTTPKVGHYTSNVWQELAATHNAGTWTATTTTFSPFAIGDAGGFVSAVLAVELLDFKATALVSSNLLMWTTANEVNNKGFQVERLMDNGQWMILGFVNAKGKAATYDFTDNTPLQISYYRLRQMDNDGKEAFSKVVSVSINKNRKLLIYPNPVSNVLTMETTEQGDFQILNLLGQQVMTGKATQPIEVSALPQGAYFLKVGTEQVKFVKQ